MASKRRVEEVLAKLSVDVDSVPVGAANVRDCVSPESEINKVQSEIVCAKADALLLQALIEIVQNSNTNKGKTDDKHIAKDENTLVDDASVINVPQNMAVVSDEGTALLKALKMTPKEMGSLSPSHHSVVQHIRNIVPKFSAAQLQLLQIQEDINQKLREVQETEILLMKKKAEYADALDNQRKQLDEKKHSEDEESGRKKKELQDLVRKINTMKNLIQGLIHLNPKILEKDSFFSILEDTRKPVNLTTYGLKL